MIGFAPDSLLEARPLNAMLREVHEQRRAAENKRRARRREMGLPLHDAEGSPLAEAVPDVPPYKERPDLDGVMVRVRNLRYREVQRLQAVTGDRSAKWLRAEEAEEKAAAFDASVEAHRDCVRAAVGSIAGLVIDGEEVRLGGLSRSDWTDEHLDVIETSGLLFDVANVALHANELTGEERGNFGASQPSISASTTATPAPSTSESMTAASPTESESSSRTPSSPATAAPAPSFGSTRGSGAVSSSTPIPAMGS